MAGWEGGGRPGLEEVIAKCLQMSLAGLLRALATAEGGGEVSMFCPNLQALMARPASLPGPSWQSCDGKKLFSLPTLAWPQVSPANSEEIAQQSFNLDL